MGRKGRVSGCSRVLCILRWFEGLSVYGSWSPIWCSSSGPGYEQEGVMPESIRTLNQGWTDSTACYCLCEMYCACHLIKCNHC